MSFYSALYHLLYSALWETVILNYEKIKKGCRWYRKFITEEHITVGLITETGKNFLTHITSVPSTAKGIILTVLLIITKRTILI